MWVGLVFASAGCTFRQLLDARPIPAPRTTTDTPVVLANETPQVTADIEQIAVRRRGGLIWQCDEPEAEQDGQRKRHARGGLALAGHRDRLARKGSVVARDLPGGLDQHFSGLAENRSDRIDLTPGRGADEPCDRMTLRLWQPLPSFCFTDYSLSRSPAGFVTLAV